MAAAVSGSTTSRFATAESSVRARAARRPRTAMRAARPRPGEGSAPLRARPSIASAAPSACTRSFDSRSASLEAAEKRRKGSVRAARIPTRTSPGGFARETTDSRGAGSGLLPMRRAMRCEDSRAVSARAPAMQPAPSRAGHRGHAGRSGPGRGGKCGSEDRADKIVIGSVVRFGLSAARGRGWFFFEGE